MKKMLMALLVSFASFSTSYVSSDATEVTDSCPTCCTTCESCKPSCMIAGWFQTGGIPAGGLTPVVISQSSTSQFIAIADQTVAGRYNIVFLKPYCKQTVTVADATQDEVTVLENTSNLVRIGNATTQSQFIYFISLPLK